MYPQYHLMVLVEPRIVRLGLDDDYRVEVSRTLLSSGYFTVQKSLWKVNIWVLTGLLIWCIMTIKLVLKGNTQEIQHRLSVEKYPFTR